jgi:hypothetical protein
MLLLSSLVFVVITLVPLSVDWCPQLLCGQVLPVVCPLMIDPVDECRVAAVACLEKACVQVRKASEEQATGGSGGAEEGGATVPKSGMQLSAVVPHDSQRVPGKCRSPVVKRCLVTVLLFLSL